MFYNKTMEFTQDILEYYDELFPVSESQKDFFLRFIKGRNPPPRFLSIGCGASNFEHILCRTGCDVTGIDNNHLLLESANRRRKIPGTTIRFFNMAIIEMARYLGAGFYSVIYCINNRIASIHDITLMKKFFYDCKILLEEGGSLVLQLPNYLIYSEEPICKLPESKSIRAKLWSKIFTSPSGEKTLLQQVETSNGRLVSIVDHEKLVAIKPEEIRKLAKEAGFENIEFFSDYNMESFNPETSQNILCILS